MVTEIPHASWLLGVAGTLILGLLAVVGHFIKRDMGKMDEQISSVTTLISKLDEKLDKLIERFVKLEAEHNVQHKGDK